jgi:hypothetical protein
MFDFDQSLLVAGAPRDFGLAAQYGRGCHHHGGHGQRRRDAGEFRGMVPIRFMMSQIAAQGSVKTL